MCVEMHLGCSTPGQMGGGSSGNSPSVSGTDLRKADKKLLLTREAELCDACGGVSVWVTSRRRAALTDVLVPGNPPAGGAERQR